MKVGVVGGGVVGTATARSYLEHVDEVRVYDVVKEKATHLLSETLQCDIIFICLPTPLGEDSRLDLGYLHSFFNTIRGRDFIEGKKWNERNFVIRSTVPIGTTKMLKDKYNLPNILHSPEFLTARCSTIDAQIPSRNVIGVPDQLPESVNLLHTLYGLRFHGVPCFQMSSDSSEAVKLFQNSFFAVKVAFWNECRTLSDKLGLDWERLMEAILADGRISHSHTKVPGPDGNRGYSGACLPKDISCLSKQLCDNELCNYVTAAAKARNIEVDRKQP